MISAPLHPEETQRLQELLRYEVLDTEDELALDELTQLASAICGTEISLVSLVDENRQWFKSKVGLDANETSREIAFCSHAILQEGIFEIPNAKEDERFHDNPLVTGAPDIRFYAGAPLVSPSGMPIGTLCVIDSEPNKLNEKQSLALKTLAKQVVSQLELRLRNRQLERMQKEQEQFMAAMAHDLRSPFNGILGLSKMLHHKADSLPPERLGKMANGILESSMKVYQLLDEMLQWSRNRLGAIKLDLQPVALTPIIIEAVQFLKDTFELKQLKVIENYDEEALAFADKSLTQTIIRNLLANAIKYAPKGSKISITLTSETDSINVSVKDQGEGVNKHVKDMLFGKVVTSKIGTGGEEGIGIGLSLCYEFAKLQEGSLTLDEDYTEGACFRLKLKVAEK